jgi:DNA-directed RNA polymerase specialized sigma24 family protein
MAKIIKMESRQQREARLVAGMYEQDRLAQRELYAYCADYYYEKYRGVFYATEEAVEEIFQDSFIKFWENIMSGRIYASDGVVKGRDGLPLSGSITTYFMGIAKLKYLEWVREHPFYADPETEMGRKIRLDGFDESEYMDMLYSDSDNIQLEIIAGLISKMSERCYEILSKFYYEDKDLDRILDEIPSIESKNALKTKKHKCMENLREVANETYRRYLKHN